MARHKTVWKVVLTHEDMDGTEEQTAGIFFDILSEILEENLAVDFDLDCISFSSLDEN